jgi:hypothetical protein
MRWHRISIEASRKLECPNCDCLLDRLLPSLDHHPILCPECKSNLFIYSIRNKNLVLDVERCPVELKKIIAWIQSNYDEVEFLSLLVAIEEIFDNGIAN